MAGKAHKDYSGTPLPKKSSGLPTDLTFETVQRIGLDAGLVDNKSGSIDDDFQGLQFVYRLKDRPSR